MKLFSLFVLLALISCDLVRVTEADKELNKKAQDFFQPISRFQGDLNNPKVVLGKKLYLEKKLSANGTISCNSCHNLDSFGVDNEKTSPGHDGRRGDRNSPTTFNANLNFKQFWDGRAANLKEQALGPLLNPIEHGLKTQSEAISKINTKEYVDLFKKAFPQDKKPLQFDNIGYAIAAFEETLVTPSRFDDYLKGNILALSEKERLGLNKFIQIGCVSCHSGAGLGGSMYQKLGVIKKYPTKDLGRYKVTNKRRDKFKFKVPILRNISKTAPYLHDGSIAKLEDMIQIMSEYQLGKKLSQTDISDIKAFLISLDAK